MQIVHDFTIRIFRVSEVRFWIIPDQSPADLLNEISKEGPPAVLSKISADGQFNAVLEDSLRHTLRMQRGSKTNRKT